jgi:molybdopterin/thiamine biosynthesis adenylyltransferase
LLPLFYALPNTGIGSCTIVDGKAVEGKDLGQNFFLEPSSLGQSRAKAAAELLSELNDDVAVNFVDKVSRNAGPSSLDERNMSKRYGFPGYLYLARHGLGLP